MVQTGKITFGKPVQSQTFKVAEMWCIWSVLRFVSAFQVRNLCLSVLFDNSSHKIMFYIFKLSVPYNILNLVSLDVGSRDCTSKQ